MSRSGNRVYLQQPHAPGIAYADGLGIGDLLVGKRHAFAQNSLFLFGGPFRRERNELFKLLLRKLLRHGKKSKQESGRTRT